MIFVQLTDDQQRELRQVSRQAAGRVALRAHMVMLSESSFSVPQIAEIHDWGEDMVRTWLHRYQEHGIAGLEDERRSGGPPPTTRWRGMSSTPRPASRPSARGRCRPAGQSDCSPPSWPPASTSASRPRRCGACSISWAGAGLVPVWLPPASSGESRIQRRGTFHWVDHDRTLAVCFVAFLEQVIACYPDEPVYLVLDSAPTHTAKIVKRWLAAHLQVQALWLPKYAAHEVNPTEGIWGLMKDDVAANRLAGSIDPLVAAACRFFDELSPHPVALPQAA